MLILIYYYVFLHVNESVLFNQFIKKESDVALMDV